MEAAGVALAIPPIVLLCVAAARELQKLTETMKTTNNTLLNLLSRIERMRLYLDLLRGLTHQLIYPQEQSMMLAFNESSYKTTLKELHDLILDVAARTQHGVLLRIYWVTQRAKAEKYLSELEQHEREMLLMLTLVSAGSHLRTEHDINAIKLTVQRQSSIKPKFQLSDQSLGEDVGSDHSTLVDGHSDLPSRPVAVWHGYVLREGFPDVYLKARDRLADAAYYGDWESVIEMLEIGDLEFGENWASAVRLKSRSQADYVSFWTPLHQAALFRAPRHVVSRMTAAGAMKTIRTNWAEDMFCHRDLTPAEIARVLGFSDLASELAPTVYHFVPPKLLQSLQDSLWSIIREDLRDNWWLDKLVMPDLHALTELEVPEMVFPIPRILIYHIYLDGRELVLDKEGLEEGGNSTWRLTGGEVHQVERAVLFNH
ncbi:hypothetical protein D0863_13057 [Hortaea werneckii]|uniref:Uncharacterized protein n=1 Tax=Hortaea werneckii TaxID=91943 RepID=A0A3M7CWD1_HORWE|nr:hypothetical protein D0863_13057 [Hortaea werneckii]